MAQFNNYEDFFRKFQRHNGQLGMSFQLPLFAGAEGRLSGGSGGARNQPHTRSDQRDPGPDCARCAEEPGRTCRPRNRLASCRRWTSTSLATRLNIALAQYEEGRSPLRQIEELRSAESEKWLAFFDAQNTVERAEIEVLRQTGTIMAALH